MRKLIKISVAALVLILIGIVALTISYTNSEDYSSTSFPNGVSINGTDCSGMSYGEAAAAVSEQWNRQKIMVVGKLGNTLAEYSDFGCTYDIDNQIESIKHDNVFRSAINHYLRIPYSATIAMRVKDTSSEFKKIVADSPFLSHNNATATQDAYVDMSDPDYNIVPEVYGSKADVDAYYEDVIKTIELGVQPLIFDENNYLDVPEVKANDPKLLHYQESCRKYLNQNITYQLGEETFTVSRDDLTAMYEDIDKAKVDRDAVKSFVNDFSSKYNTVGDNIRFKSFTGKTFTVSGGNYGWLVDRDGEEAQLIKDIESHKDVSREPVWAIKGNGTYTKLVGDTYVDIDISKQHLVYFDKGKKKFECDVVTGCWAAGYSTPSGIFKVLSKHRNITLKGGSKKKKTYYESFVSYWIGFLGNNYGMHDASWRSNFGGTIYKYSGSHGCVNMPPSRIPELYNTISIGTPVIVHY